jgi:uncharacterized protein YvpB
MAATALTTATAASSAAADASVPVYRQQQANDCEASALRMVLAARGYSVSDADILGRIGVDLVHRRFGVSGPLSGDPYRAFVGDPAGSELSGTGYGVFASRVGDVARSYGLAVVAGEGIAVADLYRAVSGGHPAIVWVDYLWRRMPQHYYTAYNGQRVPYEGPAEHTVVLVAVRGSEVRVNDPARGAEWVSESDFERGYHTYHDMAVIVS